MLFRSGELPQIYWLVALQKPKSLLGDASGGESHEYSTKEEELGEMSNDRMSGDSAGFEAGSGETKKIGRASCRERV